MGKIGISDEAQDLLEQYWIEIKERGNPTVDAVNRDEQVVSELIRMNYVLQNENTLTLSKEGLSEGKNCIRRHRLAERLFADVLDIQGEMIEEMGCKFEHLLQKEVEENICALLGHPVHCPHNKPIPPGACCGDASREPRRMVRSLVECQIGETGKIAYLKLDRDEVANKLIALGVLPGLPIKLLRKSPGYMFQLGESQFVVDRELASKIQVRFSK